jgi:hypothetical protein
LSGPLARERESEHAYRTDEAAGGS